MWEKRSFAKRNAGYRERRTLMFGRASEKETPMLENSRTKTKRVTALPVERRLIRYEQETLV